MVSYKYAIDRKTSKSGKFSEVFRTTKHPGGKNFEQLKKDSPFKYKIRKL